MTGCSALDPYAVRDTVRSRTEVPLHDEIVRFDGPRIGRTVADGLVREITRAEADETTPTPTAPARARISAAREVCRAR
jgi:hypothetical protein